MVTEYLILPLIDMMVDQFVILIESNEPSIMLIKTNQTITFLTPHVVIIDFGTKIKIDQSYI